MEEFINITVPWPSCRVVPQKDSDISYTYVAFIFRTEDEGSKCLPTGCQWHKITDRPSFEIQIYILNHDLVHVPHFIHSNKLHSSKFITKKIHLFINR
jgi:hypothetical protein